jgi:WD40 repeat protein
MSIANDGLYNIMSFKEHTERINDICFFKNPESPFDRAFITASSDGTIKLWDSRTAGSIKTLKISRGNIYSLDTNLTTLAAGVGREIGLWDLKMMKNVCRCNFAHSDDVISLKMNDDYLLSGGEDNIINSFENIKNLITMDSVKSSFNLGQAVASIDFLDYSTNFVHASTTVYTYHIINLSTGVSVFDFDSKNV